MKLKQLAIASALALSCFASASSLANVLTFENQVDRIQNSYGGLDWNNFYALDTSTYQASGYKNGAVSGSVVAFNAFANPASLSSTNAFNFQSAFFTAAWNDGLNIHVVGVGDNQTFTKDFVVNTNAPSQVFFNWNNVKQVTFSSFGGTDNPLYGGAGTHFAMDNLSVAPVPEPETYALMGMGLVGLLAARRRKVKQA